MKKVEPISSPSITWDIPYTKSLISKYGFNKVENLFSKMCLKRSYVNRMLKEIVEGVYDNNKKNTK